VWVGENSLLLPLFPAHFRRRLPWLARLEREETKAVKLNPETLQAAVGIEIKLKMLWHGVVPQVLP